MDGKPAKTPVAARIEEINGVKPREISEFISKRTTPAVFRGVGSNWPAVKAAAGGAQSFSAYFRPMDRGAPVELFVGPPEIDGKFFYQEDLRSFNFMRRQVPISEAVADILKTASLDPPPSLYVGAAPVAVCCPKFVKDNPPPFDLDPALARIWIGNAVTVWTHYDLSNNIACVVSGERRFTVFPPSQLENLYVGPLDVTMAGQPVSMVSLSDPDFVKYPKFREALSHAQVAELSPGDAIYIPPLWWHHVQSLSAFNVLVNYWWEDRVNPGSPFEAMVHAIMAVRDLPDDERAEWRRMFEYFVFSGGEHNAQYLPPEGRGILGPMTPANAARVKEWLIQSLTRGS